MAAKPIQSFVRKADLLRMYGVNYRQFVISIEEIKSEINWQDGHQLFTPKQVRRIREHLGEPLTRQELLA